MRACGGAGCGVTYVRTHRLLAMSAIISITELRQRLFQLADRVVETGEPLVIERRGVRLQLVREDAIAPKGGRLSRLVPRKQSVVVGPPLDPHESPAEWNGELYPGEFETKVAEPLPSAWPKPGKPSRRRQPR
ncbi:MAG: type II toxin-antitoxin system Phd/YefM family antitoxin [Rhodanobacteraceae bacterium]|nr:MAG: type II toxin-antitoxin system Phd/YefM family antitoxin [Rhodanobacteraceae bacterium]